MSERLFTEEEVNAIVARRVAIAERRLVKRLQDERRGDVKPMTFKEGELCLKSSSK